MPRQITNRRQEARKSQEQLLDYYTVRAPFDGVVGDIPVHLGDYVSPSQSPAVALTTVDESNDLEAYIYIPTERASEVRMGLPIDLTDNDGKLLEKTRWISYRPRWTARCRGFW